MNYEVEQAAKRGPHKNNKGLFTIQIILPINVKDRVNEYFEEGVDYESR
jgi:hypothetical protein